MKTIDSLAGSYSVVLAGESSPETNKRLYAIVSISEENSFGLYFEILDWSGGGSVVVCKTHNLAEALRSYNRLDSKS